MNEYSFRRANHNRPRAMETLGSFRYRQLRVRR